MKNVTCSDVTRTHSWARFVFPIQSCEQLGSVVVCYALALSVIGTVVYLLDPSALAVVLISAALGGSGGVYAALPGRFELRTAGEAQHFVDSLTVRLARAGYREVQTIPGGLHFSLASPRWTRWAENEIDMVARDHAIELTGPKFVLYMLKRIIERDGL